MRNVQIVVTSELAAVPWKNGGGITREVAQSESPSGFVWRLSIADVAAEGAFSHFPGMSRILTVIEGHGLQLKSPSKTHDLPPFIPFSFSGDLDVHCLLSNGAIRDFNVIFDPSQIKAEVRVVNGMARDSIGVSAGNAYAILALQGASECNGVTVEQGQCALIKDDALSISVPEESRVLYVQLSNASASA